MADFSESEWEHRRISVGELELHVVLAGPEEGPLVVLLHGFPELWYAWRLQIGPLAAAGYRVAVPDLRGYGESDKPEGVEAYSRPRLTADVAELIAALGYERAHVVGHDWGGAVAWMVAMYRPEVVERLVILNAPHPRAFAKHLRRPGQLARSWYMFFFQLPWLPEALIRAGDYRLIRRVLHDEARRPGGFSEADVERYVEAAARPGALTASINYYRSAIRDSWRSIFRPPRPESGDRRDRTVRAPTLVIWGEQDSFLTPPVADPGTRWVPDLRVERLPSAAHWVQVDEPERVNALLLEHLGG
ncbi:MAG: alpha/beta fold hydrolase [Deltaproteobacteria bacterium]|nr:alpha/beta fold hydrolase [Deltaproteobacteria bacterium]